MKHEFDIVIVGAGMVGLAVANLLAMNEHLRVTVIDAGKKPEFDADGEMSLRVSAIAPGSLVTLTRVGAWDKIVTQRACPYRDMKVWDAGGNIEGPETLSFSAAEFALPELGFIVENALIQHALLQQIDPLNVAVRFETAIKSVVRSGHRFEIELESGDKLAPDLLVGADGANSSVRSSAGIGVRSWPHAQEAFVTCLRPELSHQNTAWQRFLTTGPIGMLPLSDGRISVVWSTAPNQADEALGMADDSLSLRLTEVTDGALGKLTLAGPRGVFSLKSQHAAQYVQDGLVLIGDAAHTVHPLAGQGVNLGFADARELADVIFQALQAGENPGDLPVLRKYERARSGANKTMLYVMDGLNKLFSNKSRSLARLRGAGMFAFNKSGLVRNRVVRVALGI